jgi:hypothetical protein
MIGRADIEGSKSNVAMNAWLPQISYPCGKFSDTSQQMHVKKLKGSIDRSFLKSLQLRQTIIASFSSFSLNKISDLEEVTKKHLR